MSWSGFKKAVSRATVQVMQSVGQMDKTVDKEFDEQEKRYRILESKSEKLHREAKGYLDSVRVAQQRIAETVDHFYDETSPLGYAGLQYKQAVEKMDEEARTELDTNYRVTVLDPLGKLIQCFPDFNEAIKKRQKKLLDYDRLASVSRRLAEKPSDDPSRYPRALAETNHAKELYDKVNAALVAEIPKLVDLRVPYLDPSFEALVKTQLQFNEAAFAKLDEVRRAFEDGAGAGGDAGEPPGLEGQVEGVLQQMRELTICSSA